MDAPQISTLPDEGSPEPQQIARVHKPPRVKLRVSEAKAPLLSTSSSLSRQIMPASEEEDEDEDDEEDQLIDDDDDDDDDARPPSTIAMPVILPPPPTTTTSARGSGATSKRGVGRGRGGGRKRGAKTDAPTKTTITLPPMLNATPEGWNAHSPVGGVVSASPAPTKRRGGPGSRGGVAQRAIRKRGLRGGKGSPAAPRDDAGSISEAYAGTAASSPMPQDEHSPDPEIHSTSILVSAPTDTDMSLEGVPLPVYPLPSKPYPVQPPPKIGSGFAPSIPLDKSGKQVRKWRQANREVRGIAGGRWFTRTWIGDKESEFASAQNAATVTLQNAAAQAMLLERDSMGSAGFAMAGVMLPSLTSISMPGTGKSTPRGRAAKPALGHGTGQSSRAASLGPESISVQLPSARSRMKIPLTPGVETPLSISTPGP